MKFRAVMRDVEYMREFQNIILTLSKLTKYFVMNISADKIHFMANEEFGSSAPLVWVEIDAKLYFPEYALKTTTDEANPRIMLSMSAANLGRALTALRGTARYCKFKLTNLQFPCLTVEADAKMPNSSEQSRQVVHDVPVDVIPRCDWSIYKVPEKPKSRVVLNMRPLRLMRDHIEALKNLSPTAIFRAASSGIMKLSAEVELATIVVHYENLELRDINANAEDDKGKELIEAECAVDCKKASLFFGALQVPTDEVSFGVASEQWIHLEVNVRQGVGINSILPAVSVQEF